MTATTTTDPLARHRWLMDFFGPETLAELRIAAAGPLTEEQAERVGVVLDDLAAGMPANAAVLNADLPAALQLTGRVAR